MWCKSHVYPLTPSPPRVIILLLARRNKQKADRRQVHTMKNEKDVINAVVRITAIAHSFSSDKRELALARFILKNYYDVCCFFLNVEDDYTSGLNMKSVESFVEKYNDINIAIHN